MERISYLELFIEAPAPRGQLICRKDLRLVSRHGIEDVEQRVLAKFAEVSGF